jgi:hypothetical protein
VHDIVPYKKYEGMFPFCKNIIILLQTIMLSLKAFSLLLGLCTYHFTISVVPVGAQQEVAQCGRGKARKAQILIYVL